MPKSLIHLVCGSTGAGKTTYAEKLADQIGGIRFSIDEWMATLFWMDTGQPIDPSWAMARVERCYQRIWLTAHRVAERGIPCVLDLGFSNVEQRSRFFQLAEDAQLSVQLHYVDIPREERWRRVESRNADRGDTYQLPFDVTREMFDYVESLFEPPTEDEMKAGNGVHVG